MKNLAISRRYAKALMLIGKEDGMADQYREELGSVAALFTKDNDLGQALCNPLFDRRDRKRLLESILDKLNPSQVMRSFLVLLFDKGRIGFISSINDFYQKLSDELKGIARAQVVSATALSQDALEKIRMSLTTRTGKDVILDVRQDASLIGGIITQIGDLVLDGSVKTQLVNMRESFKKGESV